MKSEADILERRQELQETKDYYINKKPDSEGQREYHLDKIRSINNSISELDFCLNEKDSVVKESLTTKKTQRQLFQAFLAGYDSGYDAKSSNMINDNVGDGVRYIRINFNEDFEL